MVDTKKIKKAFDKFENDEFSASSEILKKEIRKETNAFLKDKLKLKSDPIDIEESD